MGILVPVLLLTVLVALLASSFAALAVGYIVAAHLRRSGAAERDTTVQTVLALANDKLGDTVAAGSRELDLRSAAFEQRVADVGSELARINDLVNGLHASSAEQHGALVENLQAVARASSALDATTQHLREVLASPKQRGQWGERMAEDVLASAGFVEGVNYRRQRAIESGSIPDFAFVLPRGLEVRMDVKFPIDNYVRVLEADADDSAIKHTKAFLRDVRARMKELADRDYVDSRDTVDCVLLFIPNESVFSFLLEHDRRIIDDAQTRKIVLCSPSSLFGVLAVIRQAVDHFQLERTSDEILRCLGGVNDQWERFTDQLDRVGKRLDTLTSGFEELQGVRRRQLEKQFDQIDRLRGSVVDSGPGEGEHLVARRAAGDIRPLRLGERDAG